MSERKKRFAITDVDKDVGTIIIDEKQLLEALGYEIDENNDVPQLSDELIKYELIEQIKRKGSTLTIFIRYMFTDHGIIPTIYLRFRFGSDYIDFAIHDSETASAIVNAIKRAKYRVDRVKAIKRRFGICRNGMEKQYQFFKQLQGRTLAEILSNKDENRVSND